MNFSLKAIIVQTIRNEKHNSVISQDQGRQGIREGPSCPQKKCSSPFNFLLDAIPTWKQEMQPDTTMNHPAYASQSEGNAATRSQTSCDINSSVISDPEEGVIAYHFTTKIRTIKH